MNKNHLELMRSFEDCDINSNTFAHIDHLGVAYEMLRTYEFLPAVTKYSECINIIATRAGAGQKFNMTITLAFLSLIAERIAADRHEKFDDFIAQNQDLLSADLLAKWYSPKRLQSDLARTLFLMPDAAGLRQAVPVTESECQ